MKTNTGLDLRFIVSRLWHFFSLYFLKPHDAINDTLTSYLVTRFDWSDEFLEIGSGDGMFSYLTHGGKLPFSFDRYLITDLRKFDIYDTHQSGFILPKKKLSFPRIQLSVDAKYSHVQKINEISFSKYAVNASYESLPIKDADFYRIFFYTAHGLKDHSLALKEASRVLKVGGKMIVLVYDSNFKRAFICKRLSNFLSGRLANYFSRLDNGRYDEITNMSKTQAEWKNEFNSINFEIEGCYSGLSHFAWAIYDIQTRPILKWLIKLFGIMPNKLRVFAKLIWMIVCFPYLFLFFLLFAGVKEGYSDRHCYVAFLLRKV